ncbi:SusC/RagA family TonB-linked outer membrane protein [Cytophagales bacterium WSM2-2]|nr:SusC/RagA family TonB-linked outer membrane protein [Cytophagales bacterium WSM2-2]
MSMSYAQDRIVSGKVTAAEDGTPMPGVNVVVKGSTRGTTTDANGAYSVSVTTSDDVLIFSFIGMKSEEISVGQLSQVDVSMRLDATQLGEVVVVGYGEQKKENLTGAVASVDTKALDSRPIADVSRGLQGLAPGLNINFSSGEIGTDPVIRIRGQFASPNGGSQPLILLDNVEIPSLQMINPQDIESISVLKDAASASIYGAKGAFGVILITSKKGAKKEGVQISYSGNISFAEISRKMEMAGIDGMEYSLLAAQRVSAVAAGAFWTVNQQAYDDAKLWQQKWGGIVKADDPMLYGRDWYVDASGNKIGLRMYDPFKAMVREWAPTKIHNFSINGMSGKTSYNIGIGYTDQMGINKPAKKDEFQRYNGSIQITTEVNKWLKVNYGSMYSKRIKSYPYVVTSSADPWLYLYRWAETYPTGVQEDGIDVRSPYSEMKQANTATLENNFANVNAGLTLTPVKNWLINFNYTYNNEENINERPGTRFTAGDSWGGAVAKFDAAGNRIYVNDAGQVVSSTDPGAMPAYKLNAYTYSSTTGSTPDNVYRAAQNNQRSTINLYSTYDWNYQENHVFKFMIGMNRVGYKTAYNYAQAAQLIDYTNPQFNLASGTQTAGGDRDWDSQLGFFGRVNYNFQGKYLIEANVRRDASSKFPKELRWRTFPSFSAGWHLDKEAFMDWSKNFLDQFKIRASWGSIGDQTVPNGLYVPTMAGGQNNWVIGGSKLYQFGTPTAVSQNIGWQNITTLDIGTDIRVLNNALGLSVDWYQRNTEDMIVPVEGIPSTFGTGAPQSNLGSLQTKGLEFQLDYTHRFTNGLRMNFVGMLSDAVTKITKYGSTTSIDNWYVGKTYGEIWGYETDRLYQKSDFVYDGTGNLVTTVANGVTINQLSDGSATQERLQSSSNFKFGPGDVKYKDLNGDGAINPGSRATNDHGDLKVIGNTTPRYEYSFRAGADWKGFDFSIFIQGVGKRALWGDGSLAIPGYQSSDGGMPQAFAGNFWRDDRTGAFYPRPYNQGGTNTGNNMWPQSKYLLNMAYTRIKNITFGYSLPQAVIQKAHLTKVRVYISLENFFTFSHLGTLPIDPENIPGVLTVNTGTIIGNNFGNSVSASPSGTSPSVGGSSFPRAGVSAPTFKSASAGVQITF